MFLTVHTSVSLVIGSQIQNLWLSFVLAFLAHFIFDCIPHDAKKMHYWFYSKDEKYRNKIFFFLALVDFGLISILLTLLSLTKNITFSTSLIAAICGGVLPDILWGINSLTKNKNGFLRTYHLFHSYIDRHFLIRYFLLSSTLSFLIQTFTFIFFLLIYLKTI